MRFISYEYGGKENIGFVEEGKVYKIDKKDMIDLIRTGSDIDFQVIKTNDSGLVLDGLKILSPISKPIHDIVCVGKNYKEHITELGFDAEEDFIASYFGKRAFRIMGPEEEIKGRFELDEALDYEVELAVIIGKECRDVKKENALDYVFGYSIFNDLSSRNLQMSHGQWYRGKSIDGYSVMGPFIVTKDELDYKNLDIQSFVNGELRQNSNTSNMIINVEEIIAELSSAMTLEAGDIISTGTPSGVGLGYKPPRYLKKADIIECRIEGLGSLSNKII